MNKTECILTGRLDFEIRERWGKRKDDYNLMKTYTVGQVKDLLIDIYQNDIKG